ncbi:MAG: hypothetical protein A3C71_02945 [Candidatus Yanofskybacteria bacterium RIFCSPHIGHO2_02_FULL_43_15c]|uniref:DOD-type homing endonuclease domain-containing protein n=1 Tax=Candidatus Yanofskybacteria bacterium RIFCSPHIGHO2_02_FULL_43_15c TaxID=1802679 RepID=A0A1F8FGN6_9BACT|nr:MAG: hypothetical protein A3C71_02945 [Candidatus Yanofskybacteria bacterium RIFCSPHIGHO2_02_FULL_43_15c]
MTVCKLCNVGFKVISNTHLKSAHGTNISEYVAKFGNNGVGFVLSVANLSKDDPRYIKWLKSLKDRNTAWAKGFTKDSHPGLAKMVKTFKIKKIDNFKKWREEARLSGKIPASYPEFKKDSNLSFLIGMTLGDGNIHKFDRTESLRIALASKYPELVVFTANKVKKVFGKNPTVRKVKNSECFTVGIYQNNISNRLGIPTGDRSRLNFKIPDWISENKTFLINFIRGLFEAEGSLSIHLPTCTYNFAFANKNKSLLKIVEKSLKLLGYHPEVRPVAVRLRRRAEVESFKQLIQFRMY